MNKFQWFLLFIASISGVVATAFLFLVLDGIAGSFKFFAGPAVVCFLCSIWWWSQVKSAHTKQKF